MKKQFCHPNNLPKHLEGTTTDTERCTSRLPTRTEDVVDSVGAKKVIPTKND